MTEKIKESMQQVYDQAEKLALAIRAKMGLPLKDEERGVLIQPGQIEERTRVQQVEIIVRTYLKTLHGMTGFNIYGDVAEHFDRYSISLEGLGRQEYIADRQPKVVQPMPSATTVNVAQPEKDGKEKKK